MNLRLQNCHPTYCYICDYSAVSFSSWESSSSKTTWHQGLIHACHSRRKTTYRSLCRLHGILRTCCKKRQLSTGHRVRRQGSNRGDSRGSASCTLGYKEGPTLYPAASSCLDFARSPQLRWSRGRPLRASCHLRLPWYSWQQIRQGRCVGRKGRQLQTRLICSVESNLSSPALRPWSALHSFSGRLQVLWLARLDSPPSQSAST